jgi:carboxymethylenebutenolidase
MAHSYVPPLPPKWNRKIEHHWVEFPGGNGDLIRGYLAKPRGVRGGPAIVQVHENIGVIPHRRAATRHWADEGFTTLTVDLYSRIGGQPPQDFNSPEERRIKAFRATFDEQSIPDLEAACAYLRTLPEVDGARIAAIGYCSGGGTLYGWVCGNNKSLKCAVIYYGNCDLPAVCRPDNKELKRIDTAARLSVPLLVHHGDQDQAVAFDKAKAMVAALKTSGQPVEFHVYPGANHVFEDETHPNYHKDAAEPAWTRTVEFLRRHLGGVKRAAAE